MADSKQWFNNLNESAIKIVDAAFASRESIEHYLNETTIVTDYFALPTSERRIDIVAADVTNAGRVLNDLKGWLDQNDPVASVPRKALLFKIRGPSL